jgi:hypothetical protein
MSVFVDTLIGVHCTHGVNRTGYLVCRYLIEKCNYSAVDAVAGMVCMCASFFFTIVLPTAFEMARGHSIEREEYVRALHDLHVDGADDCNASPYNHQSRGKKYGSNHVLPPYDVDDLASKRRKSCDDPNVEQSAQSSSRHQYRRVHSQGATLNSQYRWQHNRDNGP